ncbi:MAG TPA: bifunctional isocitrate dehydrogenase kinase/phosphatase [Burkholderiaceae bacterium]|nr:bifunctional isocitrate dehydrogenase kinase/phosphatase [Burkholderiaceae bacterium]
MEDDATLTDTRLDAADERFAREVARAILAGFDRHYGLFRYCAQRARAMFERGDWAGIARLSRERIDYYDTRVDECHGRLHQEFAAETLPDEMWLAIKRHYVTLLANHKQPECAETFFNSVCCRILHRDYFHNAFIFVRPAVATDHMDSDPPSFRVYYPFSEGARASLTCMLADFGLACPFFDSKRDVARLLRAGARALKLRGVRRIEPDFQVQVLSTLFFRNKSAYIIGRVINGTVVHPFAIPLMRDARGQVYADALLAESDEISLLFSFTRAYFLVDMDAPAAYVSFLRDMLPGRSKAELYTMLGLQKQGKTLFYRDFLHHLKHSHDQFTIAPGIKGMVMSVFTLPSYPYVFKIIKDEILKDMDRAFVKDRYMLVKLHDRVGRMADTWEYSEVALPRARMSESLLAELRKVAPSILEEEDDIVVIKHVYIERRMRPLNLHLMHAGDAEVDRAVRDYGEAIKDMARANIFPGDMLFKNFGLTRLGRVVFYDYDEIQYMTEMNFREIPPAPNEEAEMSDTPWYAVGKNDVFPEEFHRFLLGDRRVNAAFRRHHPDLLTAAWWRATQARVAAGDTPEAYPYERSRCFSRRFASEAQPARLLPGA